MNAEVTPRTPAARISRRKGFLSKRTAFVREITREVAGYVRTACNQRWTAVECAHAEPAVAFPCNHNTTRPPLTMPQSRSLREARHRTPPQLQGQACPSSREEEGTSSPPPPAIAARYAHTRTATLPRNTANTTQLGTFGRAKRKVEEMTKVISESRRAGH